MIKAYALVQKNKKGDYEIYKTMSNTLVIYTSKKIAIDENGALGEDEAIKKVEIKLLK